jgi:hypothetical protein
MAEKQLCSALSILLFLDEKAEERGGHKNGTNDDSGFWTDEHPDEENNNARRA